MDKSETIVNNIKVLFGAIAFVLFGIFITSKVMMIPENVSVPFTQFLLYILFICLLSYRVYYFNEKNDKKEFLKKFFIFFVILLPNGLLFWFNNTTQLISFFLSFLIVLGFCMAYQSKKNNTQFNYTLLFLSTIWTLLSALIVFKNIKLIPLALIQNFSVIHIEALELIRLVIGGLFIAYLIVSSISIALKSVAIWKPYSVKLLQVPKPNTNSSDLFKLLFIFPQALITIIINPIAITIFCNLIIFGIIRIAIDFLFRVMRQLVFELWDLVKKFSIVLSFLCLYILSICILYIINLISYPLIQYLKGDNELINQLISLIVLFIGFTLIFKIFVTILFTELKYREKGMSIQQISIKETLFSSTFFIAIISILLYIASWALIFLSIPKINVFQIQGFISWGLFTKYYTVIMIGILIFAILSIIRSRRQSDEIVKEEKLFFKFEDLNWSSVFSKSWLFGLFILLVFCIFWIVNGTSNAEKSTINSTSKEFLEASQIDTVGTSIIIDTAKESRNIKYLQSEQDSLKKSIELANQVEKVKKDSVETTKPIVVDRQKKIIKNSNNSEEKENTTNIYQVPKQVDPKSGTQEESFNPYGLGNGKLSIYSSCSFCPDMQVYIDDIYIGDIVSFYIDEPICDARFAVSKIVSAGFHFITIEDDYGLFWSKGINVAEGECTFQPFNKENPYGVGKGRLIFWTNCNCQWMINVDGKNIGMTEFWRESEPDCSNNKVFHIDLEAGEHIFKAEKNSKSWSGTIYVPEGGCEKVKLTDIK